MLFGRNAERARVGELLDALRTGAREWLDGPADSLVPDGEHER
jgi:hypothetical protein